MKAQHENEVVYIGNNAVGIPLVVLFDKHRAVTNPNFVLHV